MHTVSAEVGSTELAALDGIDIIDCDAHFTEPPDLWTSRAPASLHDRVPVQRTVDNVTAWYIDGEPWAGIGGNTIRRGRERVRGCYVVQPFDTVDPAAWSVPHRLDLLDSMGVYAQILYPNGIGFASNHVFAIEDLDLRSAVLRTYNDFLVDIQGESGGRLYPQALLPVWDMEFAVREMTRLVDRGIRGFTVSDKPELIGLPELPDPYFDPMWRLFDESGAVVNFHIASGNRREDFEEVSQNRQNLASWRHFGDQRRKAVDLSLAVMSNLRIIANLCMSDLFDRYPNLRVVSVESGIGWVPFLLESLEYEFDEMVTDPEERGAQLRRPSEYFREHIYVSFWFEQIGPMKLLTEIGVNNVMVETDIPHPTCLYPGAKEHFARVLADFDPAVRRRVLCDNAAELYRIPLPTAELG